MKFQPQNFNDILALILIVMIPTLWILYGGRMIELDSAVNGALISTWTVVIFFYFRKKPEKDDRK